MKQRIGARSIRLHGRPFPLFPGEDMFEGLKAIKLLPVVPVNSAIALQAIADFDDTESVPGKVIHRQAGDEWHLRGPRTYIPHADVQVTATIQPTLIKEGHAIRLRAKRDCLDGFSGKARVTGEEWLVRTPGAYVLTADEAFVQEIAATTLTAKIGLHLQAVETFTDFKGIQRLAGDEWLLTLADTESYIPDVTERIIKQVDKIVLGPLNYCVVLNPHDPKTGRPQWGRRDVRKGVLSFFLHPGEELDGKGVTNAYVLADDEAVVVSAIESFADTRNGVALQRAPGEQWMVRGPVEFIPSREESVVARRKAIPLDMNEGIYIQDLQTGTVRAVMGPTSYLLRASEQLWEKDLTSEVEQLLKAGGGIGDEDVRKIAYFDGNAASDKPRDKTRVVTFRIPHNTAVQLHDYQLRTARILYGPDLVLLGPHENFTVLRLSAGKPKRAGALRSVALMLGPDFTTDIITVETADHARLILTIAFNNYFDINRSTEESKAKIFCVPDFIGFACKNIGSRIRERVAHTTFDEFHRFSARIIQEAVFGVGANGEQNTELRFEANGLVVTNIDVQSIEPSDQQMRDSLQKSVQMAIEIATRSIEASSRHDAENEEQQARGHLETQKIRNQIEAEKTQCKLFEIRAFNSAIESTGQAKAEAEAQAERLAIEGQSAIVLAELRAEAARLETDTELLNLTQARNAELHFIREQTKLELAKMRALSEINKAKVSRTVGALGHGTILAMANAEHSQKVRLLQALNLKSTVFTDGNSPINLFNTANGLIGGNGQ
ncbi:major vault protein [Capsaspora owczarzaki ATCC 30864]|nr:major vault protein [Capsaspora owczarzaki ATCC 30864]|eukprot:XP_004346179.2 major vault protein [Capsaspora owczarzaki ATCC 30864]